jgi:hypothetical protein
MARLRGLAGQIPCVTGSINRAHCDRAIIPHHAALAAT